MEPKLETTFIPKAPLTENKAAVIPHRSFGILSLFSFIVFIASVLAAGGVYFYNTQQAARITVSKETLQRSQERFEPSTLEEFQEVNRRMAVGKLLMDQHVASSAIFPLLSDLTLKTVRYNKLDYRTDGKVVTVSLSGVAKDYTSIALQSDRFSDSKTAKNPLFSNLALDEKGSVKFDLAFSVPIEFIRYSQVLGRAALPAQ